MGVSYHLVISFCPNGWNVLLGIKAGGISPAQWAYRSYPRHEYSTDIKAEYRLCFSNLLLIYTETVLDAFANIDDTSDKAAIEKFVATYFEGPDLEFDDYEPPDWKEK